MQAAGKQQQKIQISDLLRPLEKWEVNPHCLRSIKHNPKQKKKSNKTTKIDFVQVDESNA